MNPATVHFVCEPRAPRRGLARMREHLQMIRAHRTRELPRRTPETFDRLIARMLAVGTPTQWKRWLA